MSARAVTLLALLVAGACGARTEPLPASLGRVHLCDVSELDRVEAGQSDVPAPVLELLGRGQGLHGFRCTLAPGAGDAATGFVVLTGAGDVVLRTGTVPLQAVPSSAAANPAQYQSLRRSSAANGRACDELLSWMIRQKGGEALFGEIASELARNDGAVVFHYVCADESGGWQYGALVIGPDGGVLHRSKLGVEF